MKKNLLFLPLVLAGLALSSCSKYDDSALSGRVTNVEGRVSRLEEQVKALNSDIMAIRTLVTALETKDYVTKVESITEGSRSGYRISFTKSNPITIFHGTNGRDGQNGINGLSPVVGIRQDAGVYYWTSNGEWLTDERGQRVKAQGANGRDGLTPKLKVEHDYWYVSYDNGLSWQNLNVKARGEQGVAGTNAFTGVKVEEAHAVFTLADGVQTLRLPLYREMSLRFIHAEDYAVFPNQTYEIPYITTGITSDTQIKIVEQQGLQAQLVRNDDNGGVIRVTMPSTIADSEIVVLLVDGYGHTKMYALTLHQGVLTTSSDSYLVDKSGATIEVPVHTNTQYMVEIPSEASSWISYETLRTLSLRDERIRFRIQSNLSNLFRSAQVKLRVNGVVSKVITIAQRGVSSSYAITPGRSLEEELGGNVPSELKLTSGTLSVADFQFLTKNSNKIKILDLSELGMTELPSSAFASSKFEEVKLPNGLTRISSNSFSNSSIRRISIPQSVTRIGTYAFQNCRSLTGPLIIPQGVTIIEWGAFSRCSGLTGSLVIPQGVTSIGERAFSGCTGFTGTLVIPQSVTSIGEYAFSDCTGFTGTLVIPQSVTSIGRGAFMRCSGFDGDLVIEGSSEIGDAAFVGSRSLNFRAVYSKATEPKGADEAFWLGPNDGPEPPVLFIPVGTRAAYARWGWTGQFQRVVETDLLGRK